MNNNIRGLISITAAIVMYFTPDHIDRVIETLLAAFGISEFIILPKKSNL